MHGNLAASISQSTARLSIYSEFTTQLAQSNRLMQQNENILERHHKIIDHASPLRAQYKVVNNFVRNCAVPKSGAPDFSLFEKRFLFSSNRDAPASTTRAQQTKQGSSELRQCKKGNMQVDGHGIVAIGNPERHARKASHPGSKQQ